MRTNKKSQRSGMLCVALMVLILLLPIEQSLASSGIGPDDVLLITVYGHDDLKTETRVSADGKITFPLVGKVPASGKSSIALEEEIAVRLIQGGFLHDAQVNVKVLEHVSQQVSVLGYVNKPGRYALHSNSSIVDLIAMAGGIDNNLGDNVVIVTRVIDGKQYSQELNLRDYVENPGSLPPFLMQRGDVVYVPKVPMFYIYGEVQKPGAYRLEQDISVAKALSIAGGLTARGTKRGIIINRKNENGTLLETKATLSDSVLENDIIDVDERWF